MGVTVRATRRGSSRSIPDARARSAGLALAAVLVLATGTALAQPYDPSLHFSTLKTPHFLIHFHQGEEPLAQAVARAAEAANLLLVPLLGHQPSEPTHILLVDVDDSANGYATPVPRNTIELLAAPPDSRGELNQFQDWLWQLIVHEYTHVLHLDTIRGPARILNAIFGKSLSPNDAWPHWFLEGLAVYDESTLSRGGRLKSALFDMELREQILGGRALSLSRLSNAPLEWPYDDAWYLDGSHFLDYLAQRHGMASIRGISQENAGTWIPYFLNTIALDQTGDSFRAMYRDWLQAMRTRYLAQVRALGPLTPERRLTFDGQGRISPRASPDGRTIYSILADADARPRLMAFDIASGTERAVVDVNDLGGLAVLPDGRVLLAQTEIAHNYEAYQDLFVVDPARGSFEQLTHGARLSDPDVATDGRVVAVQRVGPGRTAIVLFPSLEQASRPGRVLVEASDLEPVATPRFSPDGRQLVYAIHRGLSFDLQILDLATGTRTDLTHDDAQDIEPSFTADGKQVLFSSDRGGVFDVCEIDLATRALTRLTNVAGGAFEPLFAGGRLYYLGYGAAGWDLARENGKPSRLPAPPPPTISGPALPAALSAKTRYPVHRYSPLPTLWPQLWLPTIGADPAGTTLGLLVEGADVLDDYEYNAQAWWSLGAKEPDFAVAALTNAIAPTVELDASRTLDLVPGAPKDYVERTTTARALATWYFRRFYSSSALSVGYQLSQLSPALVPELKPSGPPLPEQGRLATALLGFSFSNALSFIDSISPEQGRSLSLTLRGSAPLLGSDFTTASVDGAWTEYLRVPLPFRRPTHHVLALHLAGGLSLGALGGRQRFGLGGPSTVNVLSDALALQSPSTLLRGYPADFMSGRAFVLASAEYRFPLFAPELGYSTFPLQLRRVFGAAFVDSGEAFTGPFHLDRMHTGIGAELRLELVLGYDLSTVLRVGYARGLDRGGENQLLLLFGASY